MGTQSGCKLKMIKNNNKLAFRMGTQSRCNKRNKLQNDTTSRIGTQSGCKLIFYYI